VVLAILQRYQGQGGGNRKDCGGQRECRAQATMECQSIRPGRRDRFTR
jgi:hypothetical protein